MQDQAIMPWRWATEGQGCPGDGCVGSSESDVPDLSERSITFPQSANLFVSLTR